VVAKAQQVLGSGLYSFKAGLVSCEQSLIPTN
jgi:hypothetical protein